MEIIKGRPIVEGYAKGEALTSPSPINFLKGVDPKRGVIIEKGHPLEGKCITGKILCFPHGCGSTVGSYTLYSLSRRGVGPKAIVNEAADLVVVVGAIIGEIPMVDDVDVKKIRSGDTVEVDANTGLVKIFRRE